MKKTWIIGALLVLVLVCSCSSTKQLALQGSVRNEVVSGNYVEADRLLTEGTKEYKDLLVYYLDSAWIKCYNEDYESAIGFFEQAEDLAEERSAKSVSGAIGTALLNENATDYTAESYEEVYCNIGMALCYYKLGKIEDGLVEAKKANTKLVDFSNNQEKQVSGFEKLVLAITEDPFRWTDDAGNAGAFDIPKVEDYSNSTFANYLSMLFFRAEGEYDEAVVDQNILKSHVGNEEKLISEEDIHVPDGKARVNILGLAGLVPNKDEASVKVWTWNPPFEGKDKNGNKVYYAGSWFYHKVAYPVILGSGSEVISVAVECSNGDTVLLSVLEDVGVSAKEAVAMNTVSNYLRSYYRGFLKVSPVYIAADMVYQDAIRGQNSDLTRAVFKKMRDKTVEAVNNIEKANLTMGGLLPGKVLAGGMTLEPGVYDFTVKYTLSNGNVILDKHTGVEVAADKLNIVISKCAK